MQVQINTNFVLQTYGMGALKFRIVIDTKKEEDIFRDILINDQLTFENFFHAIMSAFEFEGNQLASFYQSNDDWDKGREIGLLEMDDEMAADVNDETPLVMSKTVLDSLCKETGQKFILVYDFLHMWCFLIELVAIEDKEIESAELLIAVGDAPKESEKQTDLEDSDDLNLDMFDDELENEGFDDFVNIDDLDI